ERKAGKLRDRPARQLDGQRFRPEASSMADRTKRGGHVLRHPLAVGVGVRFFEVALQKSQDTRESESFVFGLLRGCTVACFTAFAGCGIPIEQEILHPCGKLLERRVQVKTM